MVYLKIVIFDCTNPVNETCATTKSLLFVNMPPECYDLVILFHYSDGFCKKYICKKIRVA